jgi:hypothetical protein
VNNAFVFGIKLKSITGILLSVFSLPISLFGRELPFYANGGMIKGILLTVLNLIAQSFALFFLIKFLRKNKAS